MAKGAYIGVGDVARKIKKGYIGVDGKARKIKKAYIGIGGVARPCWSGGELAYYGTITPLSVARSGTAATTVGNYALFGGGYAYSKRSNVVDAYDKSLTRTTPTVLSKAKNMHAATTVGNYALFGGGSGDGTAFEDALPKSVDAYDKSLTRTAPVELSIARRNLRATTVGNFALFGGGIGGTSSTDFRKVTVVDAYDSSLTRTTPAELSQAREAPAATTVGDYALFGGGLSYKEGTSNNDYSAVVDAYDKSLTRTTPTVLSKGREALAATTVGDYALFGGGYSGSAPPTNVVDAYDKSLTRTTPTRFSKPVAGRAATTVGDYAIFAGGNGEGSTIAEAYDKSLTRTTQTALSTTRENLAATTNGDYALFGGGSNSLSDAVDVYTIS